MFILTPSTFSSLLARISCKARTDNDCSNTKAQMDRSGGTFWRHKKTHYAKNGIIINFTLTTIIHFKSVLHFWRVLNPVILIPTWQTITWILKTSCNIKVMSPWLSLFLHKDVWLHSDKVELEAKTTSWTELNSCSSHSTIQYNIILQYW